MALISSAVRRALASWRLTTATRAPSLARPQGDGVADAAARAGDDGDLIGEGEGGRIFGVHATTCNDAPGGKQGFRLPSPARAGSWGLHRLNTKYFHCFTRVVAVSARARGLELEVDPDFRERLRIEVIREDVIRLKMSRRQQFDETPTFAVSADLDAEPPRFHHRGNGRARPRADRAA